MITKKQIKKFNITTRDDVKAFITYVFTGLRCAYHPDESFTDMFDYKTGERTFDDEAAEYLDSVNEACFDVAGSDIYDIALNVMFQ